jgi:hypothetical protein
MKEPRAIIRNRIAVQNAVENDGEWVLYAECEGSTAKQTCRKFNAAELAGVDLVNGSLVFGVGEDENLYVRVRYN